VGITENEHRVAVLLGADDYDSIVETIAVLSDAALFGDHRKDLEDVAAGVVLDRKQLTEMLNTAGRQLDGG
jgi:PHD/YefM family antitoxin component YafN of YafNO toxin-antitoxin module